MEFEEFNNSNNDEDRRYSNLISNTIEAERYQQKLRPGVLNEILEKVAAEKQYETTLAYIWCFHNDLTSGYKSHMFNIKGNHLAPINWCCLNEPNLDVFASNKDNIIKRVTTTRFSCPKHNFGMTVPFIEQILFPNNCRNQVLPIRQFNIDYDFLAKVVKPEGLIALRSLEHYPLLPRTTFEQKDSNGNVTSSTEIVNPMALMAMHVPCMIKNKPINSAGIINYGSQSSQAVANKVSFRCNCFMNSIEKGFFVYQRPENLAQAGSGNFYNWVITAYVDMYLKPHQPQKFGAIPENVAANKATTSFTPNLANF
jgi:hypothetical protein